MSIDRSRPQQFLVDIVFDASVREYRAAFVNARYPVVMKGSSPEAVKARVVRLVRRYFRATEAAVIFAEPDAAREREVRAA